MDTTPHTANGTHGLTHPLSLKLEKALNKNRSPLPAARGTRNAPDGRAGRYPAVPRDLVAKAKAMVREKSVGAVAQATGVDASILRRILSGAQTRASQATVDGFVKAFGQPTQTALVSVRVPTESPEAMADALATRLLRDAFGRLAVKLGLAE